MTSLTLVYGTERIPYSVIHDGRKGSKLAIHVDPDGTVSVDAPLGFTDEQIAQAVQKRARWVLQHVREAELRQRHNIEKEYVSGEQVLYLGRRYLLKVVPVANKPRSARLLGNRLEVQTQQQTPSDVRARVRAWYRLRGRDYIAGRLEMVCKGLPWVTQVPPFRFLEMTRSWGSCSASGEIIVNSHLIKAPRACIDYVLVHELAHLKHHDHGPDFWKLLDVYSPGWKSVKRQLDDMVEILTTD